MHQLITKLVVTGVLYLFGKTILLFNLIKLALKLVNANNNLSSFERRKSIINHKLCFNKKRIISSFDYTILIII